MFARIPKAPAETPGTNWTLFTPGFPKSNEWCDQPYIPFSFIAEKLSSATIDQAECSVRHQHADSLSHCSTQQKEREAGGRAGVREGAEWDEKPAFHPCSSTPGTLRCFIFQGGYEALLAAHCAESQPSSAPLLWGHWPTSRSESIITRVK